MSKSDDEMLGNIEKQSTRRKRFEARKSFWMQTVYAGTLGVIFIAPTVAGAYLGRWLDGRLPGYSISWTINLIILGIIFGATNVYLFVRDRA